MKESDSGDGRYQMNDSCMWSNWTQVHSLTAFGVGLYTAGCTWKERIMLDFDWA
jgi:hypothetical protein